MKKKLLSREALEFFKRQGSRGGKIGAKQRLIKLSPEQRSEIAKKAAAARWAMPRKPVTRKAD